MSDTVALEQMTLGQFLKALEAYPEKDHQVWFAFCQTAVRAKLHSYRGHYDQIALDYWDNNHQAEPAPTVAELIPTVREAIGAYMEGYKGGTYRMDEDTPLWVAHRGQTGDTAVVAVHNGQWRCVIETMTME